MIFIHILLTVIFIKWIYIIVSATRELSKGYAEPSKPYTEKEPAKEAPKQKEKPKSQSYKRQTYEEPKREQVFKNTPYPLLGIY